MIIIESVQLENIEFSANYLHSIEQLMLAEAEVQKLQQNAEREKLQTQITVTQASRKPTPFVPKPRPTPMRRG
jgi:regulator of protease activity HflC (stomatin/prohibitin superfamily)